MPRRRKSAAVAIDRELEIAERVAVALALVERRRKVDGIENLDDALERAAALETERHGRDHAEEAVAADREAEEVAVLGAARAADLAVRADDRDRLDVVDDRLPAEPAPVDVRGERAAEREPVRAGLLLPHHPGRGIAELQALERLEEPRPLDPGLDLDEPTFAIEREHASASGEVEEEAAGEELLPAHRVPPAGDRQAGARPPGGGHGLDDPGNGGRAEDAAHLGRVELRVRVVDRGGERTRCEIHVRVLAHASCRTEIP